MRPALPIVLDRRAALRRHRLNGSLRPQIIPVAQPLASNTDVVRPLPRRIPHLTDGPEFNSPRERRYRRESRVRIPFVLLRRLLAWLGFFVQLAAGNLADLCTGKWSRKARAVRLRRSLEGLGTTAIKIGQLFTVSHDVLPVEYADELEKLFDSVPAMPTEEAIAIIEESQGRPMREMFSAFDPVPIAGGAIACIYQAVLLTGERVAVKVRRRGVEQSFRADFYVLRMLHKFAEFIGVVHNTDIGAMLTECQRMLADEMDLRLEARQMEVFRNETKELRKRTESRLEFVSAPRVFHAFTCPQILVTEFAQGIPLREILNAIQKNNHEQLSRLAALGYDFRVLSKRLLRLKYWQTFEAMVFHADLHPSNIIVTSDQRLLLVDFGCCGTIPPKYRRNVYGFMKSVEAGDLAGVVRNVIGLSEPLPPIDVQKFTFEMNGVMRDYLISAHSDHVPWQERCNFNAFRLAHELGRRYGVPLRPELLRYFRSIRHIDFMVYRLCPKIDVNKEFRKYFEVRTKVAKRRAKNALRDTFATIADSLFVDTETLARSALSGISKMQDLVDGGGFQFGTALQKLPYVFATITTTLFRAGLIVMIIAGIATLQWEFARPEDETLDYWHHLSNTLRHDVVEGLLVFFAITALIKIVSRLRQADIEQ